MRIDNAIASLAVKDATAAVGWYEALFERPADSKPMARVAEWKFPRGGWLQVYELPERAGEGSVTLAVTDLDHVADQLVKLGIDTSQRSSNPRVKTLMIVDPDGNHLAFAEAVDQTMAR
jgi:predicted enzyme related to lactoylglutathione lyase